MREVITALITANLAAGVAILLVALLRRPVRAGFGARIAYGLWLLVPLGAAAALAPPRSAEMAPPSPIAPAAVVGAMEDSLTWVLNMEPVEMGAPAAAGLTPGAVVLTLWLAGLLMMMVWLAIRQLQFGKARRRGEAGPAVIGVFRPRIIVPADFEERFDRRERAVVLAHENVHLNRHDAQLNALVALARCVCWFNPLVHLAAHLMRVDQEMACDAAVVESHPRAKGAYAQALLKAQLTARPLPLGCYWPAGTEHPLMERIAMLKTTKPTLARRIGGAALIASLGAAGGYAAWAAAPVAAPVAVAAWETLPAIEPAPSAVVAAPQVAPPVAAQAAGEAPLITSGQICLTNACETAQPALPPLPLSGPKIMDLGARQTPLNSAFATYFNGDAPVRLVGSVVEVNMPEGGRAEIMMRDAEGTLWRVEGGTWSTLPAEQQAAARNLVGQSVTVRAYRAHDTSCVRGCVVNGRDVTYGDGVPVFAPRPTATAPATPAR